MYSIFIRFVVFVLQTIRLLFKSKTNLVIENSMLRQQLAAYQARKIKPKHITDLTRAFLIAFKTSWSDWVDALVIVKPETVLAWQKRRFKKHWTKLSNKTKKPGRPKVSKEIRSIIRQMATNGLGIGAPFILSELRKLGFADKEISRSTVSRYLKRYRPKDPEKLKKKQQQWKTFLENHRDHIMAMDFFTVPSFTFKMLYVFFIIDHSRRRIVHFNVTKNPTADWVMTQLRNAFPFDTAPKYLIFDRDTTFSTRVRQFIKDMGIKPKLTGYRCPWQNGVAERFAQSARQELTDHLLPLSEDHLRCRMREYVQYYNTERCHLAIESDSPDGREVQEKPSESAKVIALPRMGGLRHVYTWDKAA